MLRFIDIGKQCGQTEDWPREFAFFDTTFERFLTFGGDQVWRSWTDLAKSGHDDPNWINYEYEERLKSLCPAWVFQAQGWEGEKANE